MKYIDTNQSKKRLNVYLGKEDEIRLELMVVRVDDLNEVYLVDGIIEGKEGKFVVLKMKSGQIGLEVGSILRVLEYESAFCSIIVKYTVL